MSNENPKTALIIERETSLISSLRSFLQQSKYTLRHTSSFEDGVEFLNDNPVDMIFLNPKIDGISGKKFLHALQRQKKASGVPFFLLDEMDSEDKYNLLLNLRADAVFSANLSTEIVQKKILQFWSEPPKNADSLYEELGDLIGVSEEADSLQEFLNMVIYHPSKLTSSDRSTIYIAENRKLIARAAEGLENPTIIQLDFGQGIAGMCAETSTPLTVNFVENHPRFLKKVDKETGYVTKRTLVVPVKYKDELLGVIQVINKVMPYTVHDRVVLEYFAKFLAQQIISFRESGRKDKEEVHWRQNIINSMHDGFIIVSGKGDIVQANAPILKLFMGEENDLIGRKLESLLIMEQPGQNIDADRALLRTKENKLIWVNVRSRIIGNEVDNSYRIYYLKDLHEIVDAAIPDISQDKDNSDFISMIVHDIKTPIANIMAAANFLQSALEDKELFDLSVFAEQIEKNVVRTVNLVDDILDLSKFEYGKLSINPVNYDICDSVQIAINDIKYLAKLKGVEFDYQKIGHIPEVLADKKYLTRVWANLITNAIKFSPKNGKVRITIKVELKGVEKYCSVKIEDEGPGIPKYLLEKIFDKYVQVNKEENAGQRVGTGLGLTIARVFVECHKGYIFAENITQGGACFTVLLPILESAAYE